MDMQRIRREYPEKPLKHEGLPDDPMALFHKWWEEAVEEEVIEPNAMVLATANAQGRPSTRTVLLKGINDSQFLFFTNFDSRKAREIQENPYVSFTLFWKELMRQVNGCGSIIRAPDQVAEKYFSTRPRGSQIGAWASHQSAEIPTREALNELFAAKEKEFEGKEVPLPPFWGGYQILPIEIEFWQGAPNRLHDRFRYLRTEEEGWIIDRLSP